MQHWGWIIVLVVIGASISIVQAQTQIKISPDQCDASQGCYALIMNATTQCQAATDGCTILFVPGDYHVYYEIYKEPFMTVQGIKGTLTFSGYGATIITHGLHGVFYFFDLNYVIVEGLSFDMFRVPFSLGQLASVNGSQATFKIDTSIYPFYTNDSDYAWLSNVQAILEYNLSCNCIAEHSIDWYITVTGSLDEATSMYTVPVPDASALNIGSNYVIRHQVLHIIAYLFVYEYNIFSFISTSQIDLHDVNMYATPGMGFYAGYSNSVSLNNVRVEKINNRPMSLCADAVHVDFCSGPVTITNSFFEGQGDDGLNIHADYMQISQILSPTEAIFLAKGAHPAQGDAINIRSQTTFQILQTTVLSSINSSQLTYDYLMGRYCPSSLKGNTQWCEQLLAQSGKSGGVTGAGGMTGGVPYHVTLQDPLPSTVQVGDIIGAPGWLPTKVVLANNIYKNNRARGQLLTINNVYAANNTYDHQSGAAILIVPDCNYWYQSDTTSNMLLIDNTFINVNYAMAVEKADISIYVQLPTGLLTTGQVNSNITISNNRFYQSQSENAVEAYATNGLFIENNQIDYSPQPSSTFLLSNNANQNINNNICTINGVQQPCATSQA